MEMSEPKYVVQDSIFVVTNWGLNPLKHLEHDNQTIYWKRKRHLYSK